MTLSFALCLPLSLLRCVYFCLFCLFGHWMSVHACSCSETRMRIQAWAHKQLILYNIMYRFIYCACCACVYVLCSFVWLVDSIYIVCTTNRMAERSTGVWIARENSKKKESMMLPLYIQQSISLILCNLDGNFAPANSLLKFV